MPERQVVSKELADLFKIIAHPDRIRIIEELGQGEKDVNTLVDRLELPGPRVSQHLSLMRANRMVEERREGRHHFYRLMQPEMANWIIDALSFVASRASVISKTSINKARDLWTAPSKLEAND
ncbi:MAG: metalloregulator ArsR/SmtB family transcription factor [Gammaproteobacteria bacterium]|nr:metalloregulator ArsR/SmtB family transcription factor [Gammaproteobacteria bacterium]